MSLIRTSASVIATLALCAAASAQCNFAWQPGPPASGPLGQVYALAELANGDLVAGGNFDFAGADAAANLARFDGSAWSEFAGGIDGVIASILPLPNGDVVVGGAFWSAGGVPAANVARFDGSQWSPLGQGLMLQNVLGVRELLRMPNGDIVARSDNRVFRFSNTAWTTLGTFTDAWGSGFGTQVSSMTLDANGDLVVGGRFEQVGGVAIEALARYDGASWSSVPGLDPNTAVSSDNAVTQVQLLPNGELAIAGAFYINQNLARFATSVGAGFAPASVPFYVEDLGLDPNGELVAAGQTLLGVPQAARRVGNSWSLLSGLEVEPLEILARSNGDLLIGCVGGVRSPSVVAHDGAGWSPVGAAPVGRFDVTEALSDGGFVVGGAFVDVEGVAARNIAIRTEAGWEALGQGVNGTVTACAEAPDGSLIVAGQFTTAGGGPAAHIARWSGGSWSTLGGGLPSAPRHVAVSESGEILASSGGNILYCFDGQSWTAQTYPGAYLVQGIAAAPEGDFVLVGVLNISGSLYGAARWSAGGLTGTGPLGVFAFHVTDSPDGDIYVEYLNGLWRLSGTSWTQIGPRPGPIRAMEVLPGGEILVFYDGLLRWDGSSWQPLPGLVSSGWAGVRDIAVGVRGDVLVAGDHAVSSAGLTMGLLRGSPTCPADAIAIGAGCVGAAGPLELDVDVLPWIGATLRATATGLPAQSLALHALGTSPLTQPLPLGAPGCSLLVDPVQLDMVEPKSGAAEVAYELPSDPMLVGLTMRSQVVGLELSPAGGLIRTTSSNALLLTIGAL